MRFSEWFPACFCFFHTFASCEKKRSKNKIRWKWWQGSSYFQTQLQRSCRVKVHNLLMITQDVPFYYGNLFTNLQDQQSWFSRVWWSGNLVHRLHWTMETQRDSNVNKVLLVERSALASPSTVNNFLRNRLRCSEILMSGPNHVYSQQLNDAVLIL